MNTIALTALCSSELFLSLLLIPGEAIYMEIPRNAEFVDQGFRELIVRSCLEKSEIILRLALLLIRAGMYFLSGRPCYCGCIPFFPSLLQMEKKSRVWVSVRRKTPPCNESSLTEQAPEMKVKSIGRKSTETAFTNKAVLQWCKQI